jgi:hypothetical protein
MSDIKQEVEKTTADVVAEVKVEVDTAVTADEKAAAGFISKVWDKVKNAEKKDIAYLEEEWNKIINSLKFKE